VARGAGNGRGLTFIGSFEPIARLGLDSRATVGQEAQVITMMDYELAITGSREFHCVVGNTAKGSLLRSAVSRIQSTGRDLQINVLWDSVVGTATNCGL
jgi:hypothetical protein